MSAPEIYFQERSSADVSGDPVMLRQVFVNLIENAVKYTRKCERAEIEIGSSETADDFIVSVHDNGVGFDMEYVNKLFGVFQRLHRADEFEGTGIGLATSGASSSATAAHLAEGRVNEGATFYFSLPKRPKLYESLETHTAG